MNWCRHRKLQHQTESAEAAQLLLQLSCAVTGRRDEMVTCVFRETERPNSRDTSEIIANKDDRANVDVEQAFTPQSSGDGIGKMEVVRCKSGVFVCCTEDQQVLCISFTLKLLPKQMRSVLNEHSNSLFAPSKGSHDKGITG